MWSSVCYASEIFGRPVRSASVILGMLCKHLESDTPVLLCDTFELGVRVDYAPENGFAVQI